MIQNSYNNTASLYLIPTPIGNMEDITLRAIRKLGEVKCIFCEDTRITGELLKKFNIKSKLVHSDNYNEEKNCNKVLEYLKNGYDVAIVTDRGTPLISDPGYKIVEFVSKSGYNVISIPGATAFVPALTMSSISPSPFLFYGFLNSKSAKRKKELEHLKNLEYTVIFYEAPHRIYDTLNDIYQCFGDRKIAICREITKKFEEIIRDNLFNILSNKPDIKGEIVIVVEGNRVCDDYSSISLLDHVNLYIKEGMTASEAIKTVAKERNVKKSDVYKQFLEEKK